MTDTTGRISAAPQDDGDRFVISADRSLSDSAVAHIRDYMASFRAGTEHDILVDGGLHISVIHADGSVDRLCHDESGPLDVERLADVLTLRHVQTAGGCSESHRPEAAAIAAEYLRLLTAQPSAEGGSK